jgi:hypothetical protein
MSIVALKRNSKRFQVPISSTPKGFSLNGGHRNQRSIYSTNLSALTNAQSNLCIGDGNDSSIVKTSAKNTKGYLYSSVYFPTCPPGQTCGSVNNVNWVKNFSPEDHSAGQYIVDKVQASAAACVNDVSNNDAVVVCCKARSYHIGGKRFYTVYNDKTTTDYLQYQGAISAGEYLKAGLLKYKKYDCDTTIQSIAPLPEALSNSGCYHC